LARAEGGGMVPVLREVVLDGDTPLGAFVKVARPPFAFLLESVVGGERWARYTFLGTEPREVWRYRAGNRAVERWTKTTGWRAAGARGTGGAPAPGRRGGGAAGRDGRAPRPAARARAAPAAQRPAPPRHRVALPARRVRARRRARARVRGRGRHLPNRAVAPP